VRVESLGGGSGMFEVEARIDGVDAPVVEAVTAPWISARPSGMRHADSHAATVSTAPGSSWP